MRDRRPEGTPLRRRLSSREHHDAWVVAWFAQAARGLRPPQRLALFDQAFAAIFRRAQLTLGDLTLSAAAARTLREAAETFPELSSVKVESAGLLLRDLRADGDAAREAGVTEALRFLVVELLTAVGALTGEALTPVLHRELAKCAAPLDGRTA